MEDYKIRVLIEHFELTKRLNRLELFLKGNKVNSLSEYEKTLLDKQLEYMLGYQSVLDKRIELWLND